MLNFLLALLAFYFIDGVGVAHAGPIMAAIVAIGNVLGGLGIVGKILLTVGLAIGQTMLQKALAKKNKPADQIQGADLEIKMGDDLPVSTTLGTYATAGKRKYIGAWGKDNKTPNAFLTDVIELGQLPVGPLVELWINDKKCTLDTSSPHPDGVGYPVTEFRDGGKDYLWWKFYDGTQTVADAMLMTKFGGHATRPWTEEMIGRGTPYIILTYRLNQKLYSNSLPSATVVTRGAKLYDIRKDSTEGGSGAHRWDNQATWEPSDNPFVQAYNIARGMSYNGKWFFGGQNVATKRLPRAGWVAAMNACDMLRTLEGGGTEKMFRSGIELKGENEPLAIIDYLRGAANGRIVEIGGKLKPFAGELGAAEAAFTDGDIIITEGQTFEPFPMLDDIFNGATATYPEPGEKWASKDAAPYYVSDLEAEDGDRRLVAALQFPAAPYPVQVQALMRTAVEEGRRFRTHQFWLPPAFWGLEPGDVVAWSSNINGYDDKKFIVLSAEGELTHNVLVTLREVDPADYSWSPTFQLPVVIGPVGPVAWPSQAIPGWLVEASIFFDDSASPRRPAIAITADQEIDDLRAIKVQVVHKISGQLVYTVELPYTVDVEYQWTITGAFLFPGEQYEVRGIQMPFGTQRAVEWTAVTTVTMFPLAFGTKDFLADSVTAAIIADAAVTASKLMDEAVTNIKLAAQAVSTAKIQLAAVTADILANNSVIASKIADSAVTGAKIAAAAIDATKFASGIKPVEIVSSLPGPTHVQGRVVFLTTDNKMYRNTGSGWVATVPSVDITGQLTDSQIAALAAAKLTGQITSTQITDDAITTPKLAAGAVTAAEIAANAIIAGKIAAGVITATELAADSVTTAKIAANAVTANEIAANAIIAGKIAAGAVSAEQIAAKAITAKHLIITDFNNLAPNGSLSGGYASWNSAVGAQTGWDIIPNPYTDGRVGANMLRIQTAFDSAVSYPYTDNFDVVPGERFRTQVLALRSGGMTSGEIILRVRFAKADGTYISSQVLTIGMSTSTATSNWSLYSGEYVVPLTAAVARVDVLRNTALVGGLFYLGQINVTRMNSADLIVDGAIYAKHLVVTDFSNMLPDSDLTDTVNWTQSSGWLANASIAAGGTNETTTRMWIHQLGAITGGTANAYHSSAESRFLPVEPGKTIAFGGTFRTQSTNLAGAWMFWFIWYDKDGTLLAGTQSILANMTGITTEQQLSKIVTVPANAVAAKFVIRRARDASGNIGGTVYAYNMFVRRAANSELIVDGAITAIKIAANSITANEIAAGAITATELASNSVTAIKIAAGTITGDKIAANTITGDKIVANSIIAKHLVITDFENMVPDGYFTTDYASGLPVPLWSSSANSNIHLAGGFGKTGDKALIVQKTLLTASISTQLQPDYLFPVTGSERLYGEAEIMTNGAATAVGFYFRIKWYDSNKAFLSSNDFASNAPITTGWTVYAGEYVAPSNARYAGIEFFNHSTQTTTANLIIDRAVIRRMKGASLIVDGTIIAAHLAANSVTATKIAAGTITATHITAAKIDADQILQNGTTITDLIAANAATDSAGSYTAGATTIGTSLVVVGSISISNPYGSPIIVWCDAYGAIAGSSTFDVTLDISLRRNSGVLRTTQLRNNSTGSERRVASFNYYDAAPGAGTITYDIVALRSSGSGSGFVTVSEVSQRFLAAMVRKR